MKIVFGIVALIDLFNGNLEEQSIKQQICDQQIALHKFLEKNYFKPTICSLSDKRSLRLETHRLIKESQYNGPYDIAREELINFLKKEGKFI